MSLRFGLQAHTIQKLCRLFASYPQIEKAVLYGSRAKGNYKSGSDIDLTLVGDGELNLPVLYQIMSKVDDLLLPYTIDLSILKDIRNPDLLDHIRRVGATFYQK